MLLQEILPELHYPGKIIFAFQQSALGTTIIPATLGQEDLEEVFTWARFFNETGISAKLMNHPLTKLCEKLFDEHRLMDFHRCVLDVDYRKLLLNELAHN